jgi:hypothetical protein
MAKAKKMTEADLLALTSTEMQTSIGHYGGNLAENRRKALQYYLCEPVGDLAPPEIEGRSSAISSDVADSVNWMLPNLMRVFTSGDSVVEFVPREPGADDMAKDASEYINYIFYQQNIGFQILQTWFADALISKNGFVKIWWDEHETEEREEYQGLSDVELAQLLDSDEVEAIEHSSYQDEQLSQQWQQAVQQMQMQYQQAAQQAQGQPAPPPPPIPPEPMLHDVTVKRIKQVGKVRIENVPPEQFMISREALTLDDCRFCGHQVQRTRSQLLAAGYKDVDKLVSDESIVQYSPERMQRLQQNNGWGMNNSSPTSDPSQDLIWVSELYLQVDYNGDGISEWRKVVRAGNTILENEECDGHPFVSLTPIPLGHQFFGLSIADMAMESQKVKTAVLRSMLDNLYLQVNGRYFAVENQVNLDDLMTSRPGGIVRVKQPGMTGRLDQSSGDFRDAFQIYEMLESIKENRTGFTRYSQGTDADSLNKTATGVNILTNRADLRLELVARNFAELGVKPLFNKIMKLVCQHQNDKAQIRVAGNWLELSPREWRDKFELTINVGLGTGNKDQQVAHLQMLLQTQQNMFALGMVQPQNVYATVSKLVENLGFKNPEQFFVDPSKQPVQMPPNPQMQAKQAEIQAKQQELQLSQQIEQQKTQLEIQKFQAEAQIEQQQKQIDVEFERQKMQMQADLEMQKAQLQAATQLEIARIKGDFSLQNPMAQMQLEQGKADVQRVSAEAQQSVAQIMSDMSNIIKSLARPKRIVRDEAGKAIGVQAVDDDQDIDLATALQRLSQQNILRGPDGKVIGTQ